MDVISDKGSNSAKLVRQLRSTNQRDSNAALRYLHRQVYQPVLSYVLKNKGETSDVSDVFQEGLAILYKLAKTNKLNQVNDLEGYLFSICRNTWLKELKRKKPSVLKEEEAWQIPDEDLGLSELLHSKNKSLLRKLIQEFGETCFKVLTYYYYEKRSMKEIATLMQFANDQVSKNKKSLCLKKLRNYVIDHSLKKEDLL